jgi:hypothetical protein
MSLITVFGDNPFEGQSDPYVGMDSSITYDDSPQGTVVNTYSLNGVLTGCSVQELSTLRDNLVTAFDWKARTGIIENIVIEGLVEASPARQIIPSSLSFESSTYIGALGYTMNLDVFTGFEATEKDDLYNKTHTVSTSIAADGCITINTTLGCEPNSNLAHCDALEKANQWISGQLGVARLGDITMATTYDLLNESLDIDPRGGAISYSRSESNCKDNKQNTQQGLAGRHFEYCIDENIEGLSCPTGCQINTQTYRGEVYDTGASIDQLVGEIKTQLFPTMQGITEFSASYDESQSNITFSATKKIDGYGAPLNTPQDVVVNDYTITTNTDYNREKVVTLGSVNGKLYVENPTSLSPFSVNTDFDANTVKQLAKGVCNVPTKLTQQSVTYDNIKGGVSYNYGFSEANGPDDGVPTLEGVSGLSEWSVDYTPPLNKFEIVANLNCEDMVVDLNYADRGSINITVNSVSGSGYDYVSVASTKAKELVNIFSAQREELQISRDEADENGGSCVYTYSATFRGSSVVSAGNNLGNLL